MSPCFRAFWCSVIENSGNILYVQVTVVLGE